MEAARKEKLSGLFFKKFEKSVSGCWNWTGRISTWGYGEQRESLGGSGKFKFWIASRLSWEIHNGDIPAGICVLHTCDNRKCVNPAHLFLGTIKDNVADMVAKGRSWRQTKPQCQPRGAAFGKSSLTDEKVREMRLDRASGMKYRLLAAKYGINMAGCQKIVTRQSWSHVS